MANAVLRIRVGFITRDVCQNGWDARELGPKPLLTGSTFFYARAGRVWLTICAGYPSRPAPLLEWRNPSTLGAMILQAMLQRLYASLVNGPSMNARPHRSRQRCDLMELGCFRGVNPSTAMRTLLEKGKLEFPAKVPVSTASKEEGEATPDTKLTPEQKEARDAWLAQSRLLKKLRDIAEDATNYVNDHGESCLALGFPLLSMPSGAEDSAVKGSSRVLAPLLLLPLELQVRTASRAGVTLQCAGGGADLLVANPALLAWLERQTGKSAGELFTDEDASD
ncbi:MAG TPA: DUF4011 domain-containing protein, partial [Verrucomicrobiales bacterium]|nr:DUF4011 domain-containing protein [Verrucomicrobiales bacterium]